MGNKMSKEQKITGNIQPPNKDLEILKKNFPNCFDKNGDLDFEKFKTQLSKNEINFSKESYHGRLDRRDSRNFGWRSTCGSLGWGNFPSSNR